MKDKGRKNSISAPAALVLFGVFAVCVLAVLLSGAKAYRRITERDARTYDSRTCAQFIATKLRQAPAPDAVALSDFGSSDAIEIRESINGEEYITRLYCHDGWLMELFTAADGEFSPEDGEQILPARSLSLSEESGLISVTVIDGSGSEIQQYLFLRGGQEGGI